MLLKKSYSLRVFEVCKGKTCADFSAGLLKQVDVPLTASLTPEAPCGQTFSSSAADQLHIYTKSITKRTVAFTALSFTLQSDSMQRISRWNTENASFTEN